MFATLLIWSFAVISLLLVLLILPLVLLQRFLSAASSIDEVEERWMRRYGDRSPSLLDIEAVRRLRTVPLR